MLSSRTLMIQSGIREGRSGVRLETPDRKGAPEFRVTSRQKSHILTSAHQIYYVLMYEDYTDTR